MIFILFVIASVIVLALIPLYLPTKDATAGIAILDQLLF
jgi:hypothetical protein